jgi:hypothetical protein
VNPWEIAKFIIIDGAAFAVVIAGLMAIVAAAFHYIDPMK